MPLCGGTAIVFVCTNTEPKSGRHKITSGPKTMTRQDHNTSRMYAASRSLRAALCAAFKTFGGIIPKIRNSVLDGLGLSDYTPPVTVDNDWPRGTGWPRRQIIGRQDYLRNRVDRQNLLSSKAEFAFHLSLLFFL